MKKTLGRIGIAWLLCGMAAWGEGMTISRNIPYTAAPQGDATHNALDVYAPPDAKGLPVAIFVHGGGWQNGDKSMIGMKPKGFTGAGYVFVSVNYRLSPDVVHPAHVQDVANALAWVHAHIDGYGGDPEKIYLMGHSAGAHLVALVATDERYLRTAGADLSILKGVVPLDGAGYDIPRQVKDNPISHKMFTQAFGADENKWPDASPVEHVAANKGTPPFLIICAGQRGWSHVQAGEFSDRLRAVGVPVEVKSALWRNHMTLNRRLGLPDDEPTGWILDFFKQLSE